MKSTVLITGAGSGFGLGASLELAHRGHDVIATTQVVAQITGVKAAAAAAGVELRTEKLDITDATDRKRAENWDVDVLVNNAGINSRKAFAELTPEDWDNMLRVNLTSAFYTCKAVVPHMLERKKGAIINMSSSAGKTAHPNAAVCYGVSKAGINSLTQKLAYDLAPHGIRVNAVCPGPIETDMSLQWTEEYREKVFSSIPLRRLGPGADVANVAVFLASEMAAFVVGESINVNGGKYMN